MRVSKFRIFIVALSCFLLGCSMGGYSYSKYERYLNNGEMMDAAFDAVAPRMLALIEENCEVARDRAIICG